MFWSGLSTARSSRTYRVGGGSPINADDHRSATHYARLYPKRRDSVGPCTGAVDYEAARSSGDLKPWVYQSLAGSFLRRKSRESLYRVWVDLCASNGVSRKHRLLVWSEEQGVTLDIPVDEALVPERSIDVDGDGLDEIVFRAARKHIGLLDGRRLLGRISPHGVKVLYEGQFDVSWDCEGSKSMKTVSLEVRRKTVGGPLVVHEKEWISTCIVAQVMPLPSWVDGRETSARVHESDCPEAH